MKRWMVIVAALVASVLLAMPALAQEAVSIYAHVQWQPHIEKQLESFRTAHPNVEINVSFFDTVDYNEKLTLAAAGGAMPDIFMLDSPDVGRWYQMGMLTPLDRVIDREVLDGVVPAALEMGTVQGKLVALPVQMPAYTVWYYNENLFTEAGVALPTTWSELYELGRVFRQVNADGIQTRYALGMYMGGGWEGGWRSWQYLWQNGADAVTEDLSRADLNNGRVRESLAHLQTLVQEGVALGGDYIGPFFNGQVAIAVEGVWALDFLASRPEVKLGVMKAPAVPEEGVPAVQGSGWMIGMKEGAAPASVDVLRWLYTVEFDADRATRIPPPVFRDNVENYVLDAYAAGKGEIVANALSYLDYVHPFPAHPRTVRLVEVLGDMFARVFQGVDINQAIEIAEREINNLLQE